MGKLPDSFLEFHDSQILAVTTVGDHVILLLRAYIHQPDFSGRLAGWIQVAGLSLFNGRIGSEPDEYPADIYSGLLIIENEKFTDLPFRISPYSSRSRRTFQR